MKLIFSSFLFFISFAVFGQSNGTDNAPKLSSTSTAPVKTDQVEKTNTVTPTPKLSMTGTETNNSATQTNAPVVLPQKPAVFSIDKIDV